MNNDAVFFDRDGIVNVLLIDNYVLNISEFKFSSDFFSLFKYVKKLGYLAILVTNQQGISKNLMTEEDLELIHNYMQLELMANTGYNFDEIYFCPDLKQANSFRRKPNPGMILEAIEKLKINTQNSYLIGDSESDIIAGNTSELTTIYVKEDICEVADYNFTNLKDVLDFFINNEN